MGGLDISAIDALLANTESDEPEYTVVEQHGPMRFFEKEMRCASRRCSSPTYRKLQGIPYCTKHLLDRMNDMLIELGVEK